MTALASSGPRGEVSGTAALKTAEPEQKLSPTEQLEAPQFERSFRLPRSDNRTDAKATAAARRAEAKAQGLRRRDVRGVPELHAGAQRHVPEVRHVRVNDGVFVDSWRPICLCEIGVSSCADLFSAREFNNLVTLSSTIFWWQCP